MEWRLACQAVAAKQRRLVPLAGLDQFGKFNGLFLRLSRRCSIERKRDFSAPVPPANVALRSLENVEVVHSRATR
ncbi:hypothetical protein SE91_27410 [Bradyrhizobium sp. DOA1]|nr:hypothetical protein SE91_27410 [Bradyrhizobium sp. DOA1]